MIHGLTIDTFKDPYSQGPLQPYSSEVINVLRCIELVAHSGVVDQCTHAVLQAPYPVNTSIVFLHQPPLDHASLHEQILQSQNCYLLVSFKT